jgi:integrase
MNLERRGKAWRARIYVQGRRESATFDTKAQAVAWANQREAELAGARLPEHTVADALRRYAAEVAPTHKGARWEILRLGLIGRDPLAKVRLPALTAKQVAEWKLRRLTQVGPASVRREMNLLQGVFKVCRTEWHWLNSDPMADVKRPTAPPSRKRRISQNEIDRLTLALGYDGGPPETVQHRIALAFLFALETAMRAGEILGLQWADVGKLSVCLPKTKNGDERHVPLSTRAREILSLLPTGEGPVFGLASAQRDALFRKARDRAEIPNLHFHDSRAEAIWRLSKKLDVMELARVIGHRDLRSLLLYYQTSADDLAAKLD